MLNRIFLLLVALLLPFSAMAQYGTTKLTNRSGTTVAANSVIVVSTTNDSSFTTTTTEREGRVIGITGQSIANGSTGQVIFLGVVSCQVAGTVNRGDYLITSTTAGKATSGGTTNPANAFGIALTGGTDTTVQAALFPLSSAGAVNTTDPQTPTGLWTFDAGWKLNDNDIGYLGTDNDYQIYYDAGADNRLEISDGSNLMLAIKDNGSTALYTLNGSFSSALTPSANATYSLGADGASWLSLFGTSSIIMEGSSNDAYETTLTFTNPTADRTITVPNASGTVLLSGVANASDLADWDTTGRADGYYLRWNAATGKNYYTATTSTINSLDDLDDVTSYTGADGRLLIYNSSISKFDAKTMSGDGSITSAGVLTVNNDSHSHTASTITLASSSLTDMAQASLANADVLLYDTGTSKWRNRVMSGDATISNSGVVTVGDDSHSHTSSTITLAMSDLTDVDISGRTTGDVLVWNGATGKNEYQTNTAVALAFEDLTDSDIGARANGKVVAWNSSSGKNEYVNPSATVSTLADVGDVDAYASQASGDLILWDGDSWANKAMSGDATITSGGVVTVADDSHAHTSSTISGLDISSDTNLSASNGIVLTDDALSHSTAEGYKHIPSAGSANQLLQYVSAGTASWVTISGDVSLSGGTATLTPTTGIVFEGSTADEYETTIAVTDPNADRTITFPNVSGTVAVLETNGTAGQILQSDGDGTVSWTSGGGGGSVASLADIGDVDAYASQAAGDLIIWDGDSWVNKAMSGPVTIAATGATSLGALTDNWSQTGAYDIILANASSELHIMESSGATYYGIIDVGDLSSSNKTYTFPDLTGTVALTGASQTVSFGAITAPSVTGSSSDLTLSPASGSGSLLLKDNAGNTRLTIGSTASFAANVNPSGSRSLGILDGGWNGIYLSSTGINYEGTANAYETTLSFTDPTADRTITFPDADGTVALKQNRPIILQGGTALDAVSNTAVRTAYDSGSNDVPGFTMDFDPSTAQYCWWGPITLPTDYGGGTFTCKIIWTTDTGTNTNGTVYWEIAGFSTADGETTNGSLGSAATASDDWIANFYNHTCSTGALTLAGSPAASETVWLRVKRDATNGSDDLAVNARLLTVILEYAPTN